ncbi:MAG: PAS domain-containing protein [Cyanobacteria bacterium J06573_11]
MIVSDHSHRYCAANGCAVDPTAFYEALWNNQNYGMCILAVIEGGADFRFLSFNQAMEISPLKTSGLTGMLLSEAFEPELVQRYHQQYNRCIQTGQTVVFEEQLTSETGDTWWRLSLYPLRDPSGKIHQLLVSTSDITAKRQAEIALEASKQVLQQVIDTLPSVIFWKDRNSQYQGCNQAFAKIAGCETLAEMIGKTDYDLPWKKEESDWFVACDRKVMAANKPELNIIEPQLQANNREAWLSTSKIPLHDANGNVSGILGIIEDITEHKHAQDEQARLLEILEATPDVVGITDLKGTHNYLNRAGQLIFGIDAEQVQQFHLSQTTSTDTANLLIEEALPVAEKTGMWSGESMLQNTLGQIVPVSHVVLCHKSEEGEPKYFSSIMRDISDRKAAEITLQKQSEELIRALQQLKETQSQIIQAEKMSSLGQMVAGIAHEINNPVNFIHGNLEPANTYVKDLLDLIDLYGKSYPDPTPDIKHALETTELDFVREDLPKLLNSMIMGTRRIREIVLSLRNFSRLDESDLKTVDIHEGIDSTLVILSHRLKADTTNGPIEIVKQYGDIPSVCCHPSQLNQVFMNILANAIDALESHPNPQIIITTQTQDHQLNIRIADNGPGMSPDVQSQIIDPFFTTKAVGKGTGMGMAISYQIITEKHGGQFLFTSEVDRGTEFSITIPIKQANCNQSAQPS